MSDNIPRMRVQVLNKNLQKPFNKVYPTDSGYDLQASITEPVDIKGGTVVLIPTGVRIALPSGYEAQVRSRSGLAAKHCVFVLNSPGTIDEEYRGEIGVILGNLGASTYTVMPGDRIAQLVPQQRTPCHVFFVEDLDSTARGEDGFGSSGR